MISPHEIIIDNFAGGGGASTGMELALGRSVDIAINHDPAAIAMHKANHPGTHHYCEDVWKVDPVAACAGRPVGLAWFSPDCKHFSRAKGAKPVTKKIRGLAWVALKWARLVSPRIIMLENVREFQEWGPLGPDDRPCKRRKGQTFKSFCAKLRKLGYAVEFKVLNAADFGAPTHRRRLFLVSRRDGSPIHWPTPTHGPGLRPYRTAAECIDWSIPCPSIFARKKPLAEKTMRRIAMGLKKYVLDNPTPFIVNVQHGGQEFRGQSIDKPLSTVTAKHGFGIVAPYVAGVGGPGYSGKPVAADAPMGTQTAENHRALCAAFISKYHGQKQDESRCASPDSPLGTQDTQNRFAACMVHFNHGAKQWSAVDQPLYTVTAGGLHAAEVRAFLIKYFGCGCGQVCTDPLHTVTSRDRFGLVTVEGADYQIADIGLRMLKPRELLRAQFSPELAEKVILPDVASVAVAKIGNSVAPLCAAALVAANFSLPVEVAA